MKFTVKKIQNLKPKAQRYEEWEGNGFGVRVTPKGVKSFVYLYRFDGKARRLTLGTYPTMSLADAHKAHGEAMKKLEQGIDPGTVTVAARRENREAPTVADLAEEYLTKWARPRKRSWTVDKRVLEKDVLPEWGRRKAKDILRRDIIRLLDRVAERGGVMANRTLAVVRKMFNFGATRDLVPVSPCIGVQAPALENRRDRVLSAEEIKNFWRSLDNTRITPGIKLALRLMLVSAQRKGEVISAQWADINLAENWWIIPETKNGLPHRVPLSAPAVELLKAAKTMSGDSPWVFSSVRRKGPVSGASVDHALRLALNSLEMEHFTPHDLRRTAATFMTGSCGIPRLIVSKILNHAEAHITAVYDRASYDKEKQMALDAWGRKLQDVVEGVESNVVPMVRGA
ncbi:MAG: tyrosine-type recombinase/integrase [Desulfobaccales bacterium]